MKRRVETGDVLRLRQSQPRGDDPFNIRRQMQRRQRRQPAQIGFKLGRDRFRAIAIRTAMDDPMADIADRAEIGERFKPRYRPIERRGMIDGRVRLVNDDGTRIISNAQTAIVGANTNDREQGGAAPHPV